MSFLTSLSAALYPLPEPQLTRDRPLQVVALGLGRSGTESLYNALKILGYDGISHGFQHISNEGIGGAIQWQRLADRKMAALGIDKLKESTLSGKILEKLPPGLEASDFDKVLGHCEVATDMPASAFGPELLLAYPDALVVLNYRHADGWINSFESTIEKLFQGPSGWFALLSAGFDSQLFWQTYTFFTFWRGYIPYPVRRDGHLFHEKHYGILEQLCQEQGRPYLKWNISDGWEPLCKFLGKPVPDVPFPKGNPGANYASKRSGIITERTWRAHRNMACTAAFTVLGAGVLLSSMSRLWWDATTVASSWAPLGKLFQEFMTAT